ncbi:MAG: diguanylate cyclase [Candidatus Omnitrophota bacterium]
MEKVFQTEKVRILVVDDEKQVLELLERNLSRAGYQVLTVLNGDEALAAAKDERPDLILLDILMPGIDGREVKAKLNEDTSTAIIPVIFLTGMAQITDKAKGFDLGIDDYITKPCDMQELQLRVKGALNRRRFYEQISMTDGLTGLYNIYYFKKQFDLFFNIAKRYKKMFSVAIIDVDDFKKINDTHSHAVGDFVLKKLSSVMEETLRKPDVVTRYGGDEFTVILPESDQKQAIRAIERVKEMIDGKEFTIEETGAKISFSISAGVAAYRKEFKNETQMFEAADADMYEEKRKKQEK